MSTTAYHRTLARDYELRCEWERAAIEWQSAIDAYPAHHAKSQLAQKDLQTLAARRDACAGQQQG
jgi:hypothetical protein